MSTSDTYTIIFAIESAAGEHRTHITPIVAGPLCKNPDVVARALQSRGDKDCQAITALLVRHVGPEIALALLAPRAH